MQILIKLTAFVTYDLACRVIVTLIRKCAQERSITVVRPPAKHGAESWPVTKSAERLLHTMETRMFFWSFSAWRHDPSWYDKLPSRRKCGGTHVVFTFCRLMASARVEDQVNKDVPSIWRAFCLTQMLRSTE